MKQIYFSHRVTTWRAIACFQLELWRRQATGTVSEFLGPKALRRDIGTRLFLFRGDLKQELNWYHPHGEIIINAFVNGINSLHRRNG
jgi:penicillin amidase